MSRPNLLIIMSDQHGARWCGCYGAAEVRTPEIDSLARDGVVFDAAYCHSPLCVPSRMAFMTGRRVQDIEIWDNNTVLSSDEPTWAHRVAAVGYDAVLSGKMHFAGPDKLHGFRAQLAADPAGDDPHSMPVPDWEGGKVGSISVTDIRGLTRAGAGTSFATEVDDLAVREACRYIRDRSGNPEPWALMVGLYLPHPPLTVEERYFDLYPQEPVGLPRIPAGHLERQHAVHRRNRSLKRSPDTFPVADVRAVRRAYCACVTRVDSCVGAVIDALRRSGQLENTVVVYTSDHGEMLGEHGLWTKSSFYDESARVPLVVRAPGVGPSRVSEPVSLLDLTATIFDLAGADADPGVRPPGEGAGESLLPLLTGAAVEEERTVHGEYCGTWVDRPLAMVRRGPFKLVSSMDEAPELYDLATDPGEYVDLGADPRYATVVRDLRAWLAERWDAQAVNARVLESQRQRLTGGAAPAAQGDDARTAIDTRDISSIIPGGTAHDRVRRGREVKR